MKCLVLFLTSMVLSVGTVFGQPKLLPQEELLAPHPMGPIGLFRTFSAERQTAGPLSFGQSVTGTYFSIDDFPSAGEEAERLAGRASLSFTPISEVELFLSGSALTSNGQADATLLQQVGNMDFGVLLARELGEGFTGGALFQTHYRRAVGDLNRTDAAFSYDALAVLTYDLMPQKLPLRLHANAGFRWDGTSALVDPATGTERQRVILDVLGRNAVLAALGVEVPISPFAFSLEYSTEQTLDTTAAGFIDNPQRITTGVRFFPTRDRALTIEGAVDFGMFAADGPSRVVREPDVQFLFGMTYLFGTAGIQREIKPAVPPPPPPTGKIFGRILDAKTGQPVGGALISLCGNGLSPISSDRADGTYRSYALPNGDCTVKVTHERYEAQESVVRVTPNLDVQQDFTMTLAEPRRGVLVIQAKTSGGVPTRAQVVLLDLPQAQSLETNEQGMLRLRLPVGTYHVEVSSPEYGKATATAEVLENGEIYSEFILRNDQAVATLARDEIRVRQQIQFATGSAVLLESSKPTLDFVADLLKAHPEILKLEIGGHTDSTGNPARNLQLSQKRAAAVLAYLVEKGVEGERVVAVGYGQEKPISPNTTKEGRLANRRVEFKIIEK